MGTGKVPLSSNAKKNWGVLPRKDKGGSRVGETPKRRQKRTVFAVNRLKKQTFGRQRWGNRGSGDSYHSGEGKREGRPMNSSLQA